MGRHRDRVRSRLLHASRLQINRHLPEPLTESRIPSTTRNPRVHTPPKSDRLPDSFPTGPVSAAGNIGRNAAVCQS
jgi:hypothetical protein